MLLLGLLPLHKAIPSALKGSLPFILFHISFQLAVACVFVWLDSKSAHLPN